LMNWLWLLVPRHGFLHLMRGEWHV
jgi:hypothetical protein